MKTINVTRTCEKLEAAGVVARVLICHHPLPVQRKMLRELCAQARVAPVYHLPA